MRSLISIDFPAPKMEPESAHVVSAVSVHWLQCGDCTTQATYNTRRKVFPLDQLQQPSPLRLLTGLI